MCVLTSSFAAPPSLGAGPVQEAHVRHLDSRSSLCDQLPGSLSQLPSPLGVALLHRRRDTSNEVQEQKNDNRHHTSTREKKKIKMVVYYTLKSPEYLLVVT